MALVNDLNELLMKVRGSLEAARALADEIRHTDPDIVRGLSDIVDNERWSSSGLYHRITQLDATPTLLSSDFVSKIAAKPDLQDRLKAICNYQRGIARDAKSILNHNETDPTTRELLEEMHSLHKRQADWCSEVLKEWEPD